jgi:hypothetical protein
VAVAVVPENGGINQKQRKTSHHQECEPPCFFETNLENKAYSDYQLNENQ